MLQVSETLKVRSEISGEMSDCTICQGILLDSGERIAAVADVDMFAAFNVDMYDAIDGINKREKLNIKKPSIGSMLWRVECIGTDKGEIGRRRGRVAEHNKGIVKTVQAGEDSEKAERKQMYRLMAEAGIPLFDENDETAENEVDETDE